MKTAQFSAVLAVLLVTSISAFAQSGAKMADHKMADQKMAGGKMADHKMASGKMTAHMMAPKKMAKHPMKVHGKPKSSMKGKSGMAKGKMAPTGKM